MYEAFYGLETKPFSILPDPDFIFWTRPHSLAFGMMEYGVMNGAGFTVITGEIGCGKTTLIRKLLQEIGGRVTIGLLSNTGRSNDDLLRWVLASLDQPFDAPSYVALFKQFEDYLFKEYEQNRHVLLIIDEAQNLGPAELEELRMLSNINVEKEQLLQLIFVGQPQLKDLLAAPELRQFVQRISSDFHLGRLSNNNVSKYIDHRISIAGGPEGLFTVEACDLICRASGGIPRTINIICDTAMIYGFAHDTRTVDAEIVRTVIRDKQKHGVFSYNDPDEPVRPRVVGT